MDCSGSHSISADPHISLIVIGKNYKDIHSCSLSLIWKVLKRPVYEPTVTPSYTYSIVLALKHKIYY